MLGLICGDLLILKQVYLPLYKIILNIIQNELADMIKTNVPQLME